jgi:hypothetical protein
MQTYRFFSLLVSGFDAHFLHFLHAQASRKTAKRPYHDTIIKYLLL